MHVFQLISLETEEQFSQTPHKRCVTTQDTVSPLEDCPCDGRLHYIHWQCTLSAGSRPNEWQVNTLHSSQPEGHQSQFSKKNNLIKFRSGNICMLKAILQPRVDQSVSTSKTCLNLYMRTMFGVQVPILAQQRQHQWTSCLPRNFLSSFCPQRSVLKKWCNDGKKKKQRWSAWPVHWHSAAIYKAARQCDKQKRNKKQDGRNDGTLYNVLREWCQTVMSPNSWFQRS